jgi:hypothetical protein
MSDLTDLVVAFQQITLSDAVTEMSAPIPKRIRHCSACGQEGHTNVSKSCPKRGSIHPSPEPSTKSSESSLTVVSSDSYTREILREMYDTHMAYVKNRIEAGKRLQIHFRLPCIPEDISENIIKFAIHRHGDTTSRWDCKGDLLSTKVGKQECKCFTSDGPLSFTPSSEWDEIYFMDARNWLDHHFIIWKCTLRRSSDEWKQIHMSKSQTFHDQCIQGRRPHITWKALYPQIQAYCEKIIEGTLEDILSSV